MARATTSVNDPTSKPKLWRKNRATTQTSQTRRAKPSATLHLAMTSQIKLPTQRWISRTSTGAKYLNCLLREAQEEGSAVKIKPHLMSTSTVSTDRCCQAKYTLMRCNEMPRSQANETGTLSCKDSTSPRQVRYRASTSQSILTANLSCHLVKL